MNFDKIVAKLSEINDNNFLYHFTRNEMPMPSIESLSCIMENLKSVLFPGFFGNSDIKKDTLKYHIGASLDLTHKLLSEQIQRGFCFACEDKNQNCIDCNKNAQDISTAFIEKLPTIKHLLSTDVVAAYNGDPASMNHGETIFCYPSIRALTHYRIAHELRRLEVPLIPRIITEMSHALTGIDIHPGAQIGEYFFIDHGTGVVIGETCIIGKNVRLYQGVTLGAKSFPLDENGKPIKGIPRHPIVEDDVIIYSNATILGRITIGKGAVVGGNMWITKDIPAGEKVLFDQKNIMH
ncbi:MAG: serine acetyltransferase [Bacteroidales bacterium]|nr:serine acetyltransferase [Bacteroidales bacterium]